VSVVACLGVIAGASASAYATSGFWEGVYVLPCVIAAGLLAAAATYIAGRGIAFALLLALATGIATFIVALAITSARWGT
jgi:hypothetical protein